MVEKYFRLYAANNLHDRREIMALAETLDNVRVLIYSAIRIQSDDGTVIYCDPYDLVEEPHDADVVFITHGHYDHLSPEDYFRVAKAETVVVASSSLKEEVAVLNAADVVLLNAGDFAEVCGIKVEAVPAYNVESERLQFHPKENAWVGYVLTIDGTTYYIAGDTDQNKDTEQVRCDVALVPIGGTYTMDAKQAAAFINTIKPRFVIPTHYGTTVGNKEDVEVFEPLVDDAITVVRKMDWRS